MKSEQSEQGVIREVLDRLAMSHPEITFTFNNENRKLAFYPATDSLFDRVAMIIGHEFKDNALPVQTEYEDLQLSGFIGLPTYTRSTGAEQYLFVNGRSVKDKVLLGAIRGAYQGLMGHGSDGHPVLALFLSVPKHSVDVNVSPAKTEVRFADSARIRGLLVASLRNTLATHGNKTATTLTIGALDIPPKAPQHTLPSFKTPTRPSYHNPSPIQHAFKMADSYQMRTYESEKPQPTPTSSSDTSDFPPLGFAKAQLHKTYIVSQTQNGIAIKISQDGPILFFIEGLSKPISF